MYINIYEHDLCQGQIVGYFVVYKKTLFQNIHNTFHLWITLFMNFQTLISEAYS